MNHLKGFNEAKKPAAKTISKLDYHDMMEFLEEKYNFKSREFTGIPSTMDYDRHFDNWCDSKNLPKKDSKGKDRHISKEFLEMYAKDPDGENAKPPYMDYWHYLCDLCEPHNGSFISIPKEVYENDRTTPSNMIKVYQKLIEEYPNDKEMKEICDELIRREEEEIKNPRIDTWSGWKQKITDLIFKEFGEYADNDSIQVWVEW